MAGNIHSGTRARFGGSFRGQEHFASPLCLHRYAPPGIAPMNMAVELQVNDGISTYTLPFPCLLTPDGEWINAIKRTSLASHLKPVGFRYRSW